MKKLAKKLAVLITVLCVALTCALFAACGEGEDKNNGKYTVTVVLDNADKTPAQGVLVAFCDPVTGLCNQPVATDANGVAVFEGDMEYYHVQIVGGVPAGYTDGGYDKDGDCYTKDWNGNSFTITLPAAE